MTQVRYHQMLVSPHVGGGAKLAMQIHTHAAATRGPVSRLLLPPGGEAERTAIARRLPFAQYRLDRLTGANRMRAVFESLQLYRRTATHGAGVLHVHSPFVYGSARPFLTLSRLRRVLHIHLDFTADDLRWALTLPPDLIIVCAGFMRPAVEEALGERAAGRTTVRVIRNAVDTRVFFPDDRRAAKSRLGVSPAEPLAMVVANLSPHKGQETAIRAVAALKAQGQFVRLWIAGAERDSGNSYLEHLKALCGSLQVSDRVDFVGFRTDTPELFKAADFLLLPSTSEGLPLAILEAQASKAVVLAAPTAGIPEVIRDGSTGYLIAADDPAGYAARMDFVLRQPDAAAALAESAYRYVVEQHEMHTYCERVLQEYDELLPLRAAA